MHKIIQIYPSLLKLSRKQESVTDEQTERQTDGRYYYIPSLLSRGDNKQVSVTDGQTDGRYYYIPSPLSRGENNSI